MTTIKPRRISDRRIRSSVEFSFERDPRTSPKSKWHMGAGCKVELGAIRAIG